MAVNYQCSADSTRGVLHEEGATEQFVNILAPPYPQRGEPMPALGSLTHVAEQPAAPHARGIMYQASLLGRASQNIVKRQTEIWCG